MNSKILSFFMLLSVFIILLINISFAKETDVKIVYFYSSTCTSCQELESYFNKIENENSDITIIKKNISDMKNKSYLNKYNELYKVLDKDKGIVPVVFIHDKYYLGENEIKQKLEEEIKIKDSSDTVIINSADFNFNKEKELFSGYKILGVFLAGLVNGLNPCSLSMLVFFLSLLIIKSNKVLKIGLAFIAGKVIMYFLLGTVLFNMLSIISLNWLPLATKVIIIIFTTIFVLLSLNDYIAFKNKGYRKIILQLPPGLMKFNHALLNKITNATNNWMAITVSFILGLIISCGEFLCTGQLYLATILTIMHTDKGLYLQSILYLLIYVISLVIPLLIIVILVNKGKEIINVSEKISEKMHLIKLINAIAFSFICLLTLLIL